MPVPTDSDTNIDTDAGDISERDRLSNPSSGLTSGLSACGRGDGDGDGGGDGIIMHVV